MASWYPSPLPDPRSPPPRARCHSQLSAWQWRAQREFQSSPRGARAEGTPSPALPEPGLCRPLPAGFASQHTRSCCDYKRLLWAPSQECCGHCPHPCTLRGRGPGHQQPAGPAQHLAPVLPQCPQTETSPWRAEPTQGTQLPQALLSPRLCAPAKPHLGLPTDSWADNVGLHLSH